MLTSVNEPSSAAVVSGTIQQEGAPSSARTQVAASGTVVTALAANTARRGASFHNDATTGIVYLALGTSATVVDYTVRMVPQAHYEVPFWYTGIITAIWSPIEGSLKVTEIT